MCVLEYAKNPVQLNGEDMQREEPGCEVRGLSCGQKLMIT